MGDDDDDDDDDDGSRGDGARDAIRDDGGAWTGNEMAMRRRARDGSAEDARVRVRAVRGRARRAREGGCARGGVDGGGEGTDVRVVDERGERASGGGGAR
jgi:hypothetical protein